MVDEIDRATKRLEVELNRATQAARLTVAHLAGPARCTQCGDINDRRQEGWAICSECNISKNKMPEIRDYADSER